MMSMKEVLLPNGAKIPPIGQGTWFLAERRSRLDEECDSIKEGIALGMNLIDTAEMYGSGRAERLVGRAVQDFPREGLFLVSKVYPHNAGRKNIFNSCEASLRRLKTDYLDLYLLHWRGNIPLSETVECLEQLKNEGKIRAWGVSNFDTEDMQELWNTPNGQNCMVNQVLYNLATRGIEYDLLPWQRAHHMPIMAYCPLAQGGYFDRTLYRHPALLKIAAHHGATVAQVLLAFVIRNGDIVAIPKAAHRAHVQENAAAGQLVLNDEDLAELDKAFPAPKEKVPLAIV